MRNANRYLIALVAALGLVPVVLDATIVTVALTPIRADLRTDVNTVSWIVTGFFLANAAVVAIGGYLANRFGRKRMFVLGIAVFTLGSLLCAIAPDVTWLIAFRVLQGIGGGILLPIGPAMAFEAFAQEERAKASAVVAVPLLLAPVFGPILGGYLTDTFDWHSIFLVNLPVGVIALAVSLLVLPRDVPSSVPGEAPSGASRKARGPRFDYLGLILSTLGVVAIVYAFKLVTQTNPATVTAANPGGDLYGWSYQPVAILLVVGVALLALFAVYALWISRDPALDLRQLGRRDFLVSSLLTWVTALVTFGLLVLLPLYFEAVRQPGLSALDTGLALVPFGAGTIMGTIGAAALYRALGPRWVVALGAAFSAVSAWVLAQVIQPTANAQQLFAAAQGQGAVAAVAGPEALRWGLFLVGLSFTFINIPVQTLALEALQGEALAKASSLFLSTKLIFSSVGVAILTTVLVDRTRGQAADLAAQVGALAQNAGVAPGNPAALAAQIGTQAGTWAIQSIFWLIFFGSFGVVALALVLPGRKRHLASTTATQQPVETPAIPVGI